MAITIGVAAHANEPSEDQQRTDIIVTGLRDGYVPQDSSAAKVALPLRDIPQSIAVVPAEVLRDQRALSLQDAVRNVPGVTLASGDGQRDEFRIRGFTAIADQFVDGFRDDALYYRDLSNVDRVEVIKGPAAVLYGRGSSGGLINRVTKKPDGDIIAFVLSADSFESYRGEVDIGRLDQTSHVGFRLTGALEDNGSFREQQFLKRFALAPSVLIGAGQDTAILIQADYVNDRRLMDLGIPALNGRPVDVPRSTYYGAANARDADLAHSEVLSQRVAVTHRFSDTLSLRNGFNHYRYTLDRQSTIPSAVNAAALTVTLEHSRFDRDEEGWSNQTELTQKLNLLGTAHTILYGFEIAHQNKGSLRFAGRTVAVTSIFDPVLPVVDNDSFNTFTDNSVTRLDTRGLYVQDLIDFGHGIKAMLGLRHDWFIQKTDRRLPGQTDLARTDRNWSPRAGLLFQPDTAQSYYVSWSRSFQPSAETFALAANNTDIEPEQTTNKEVGAKYTLFGGRLSVQAAAFILRRTGIKGTDPVTQRIVPIGTQRTRGIELSAALDLPENIRAIAGYAHLDTRVTESAPPSLVGKRATLTPLNSANLFVTKTIAARYGLGGGVNYVGDRWADPANTTVLPSYVTFDALAWAQLGPVRLQLNAYNLTNKQYIIAGHGTSPILNLPGAPRSVIGTARFSF
ncbi:TonB-dependent siderophore receptor [Sphingobium sp. JS3065]|uniref:TonB-dependent receptor n=1 Tax=Sphingobium sp. JS3065 TaxID=2970925 RepID=UPI002264F4E5|nr:TonB-dependent siderophore receptor [Sphingobium sp. JS3065]UZW54498.1 TonB-dependent siderophore receptor [Sphingobium sp. JS3065]